jgi:hypothetical protein
VKSVEPSFRGLSSKLRTPLNNGATPPVQIMRAWGTTPETLGLKTRSVPGTCKRSSLPSPMRPSMRVTVEFQRGKSLALVNNCQIRSAGARMWASTPHTMEKT